MTRIDIIAVLTEMAEQAPLTPSRIVEEARDENHPLHDRFQWDDGAAAHEYRLIQGRKLLTVLHRPDGARQPIPLLIHIPSKSGEGEYALAATVIRRQPDRLSLARDEALRFLRSAGDNIDQLDEAIRLYRPSPTNQARTQRARKSIRKATQELAGVTT